MKKTRFGVVLLATCLLLASSAFADPAFINVLSQSYHIHAELYGLSNEYPLAGTFDLTSNVSLPDDWYVLGNGSFRADVEGTIGSSSGQLYDAWWGGDPGDGYIYDACSTKASLFFSPLTSSRLVFWSWADEGWVTLIDFTTGSQLFSFTQEGWYEIQTFTLDPSHTYLLTAETVNRNSTLGGGANAVVDFYVPEPSTFLLLFIGLGAVVLIACRRGN